MLVTGFFCAIEKPLKFLLFSAGGIVERKPNVNLGWINGSIRAGRVAKVGEKAGQSITGIDAKLESFHADLNDSSKARVKPFVYFSIAGLKTGKIVGI